MDDNLRRSIDELRLSVRTREALEHGTIKTVGELVQKSEDELLAMKNFGRKSLKEIRDILASMGLQLGMKPDDGGV